MTSRAYRVVLTQPITVQWRYRGQHGAQWYDQIDFASGDPVTFDTVPQAQEWIREKQEGLVPS